ncbi:MAG: NAD(P)/FAD-dependent oxidoreductase [Spirochaetes bacterium]|nr:NAD(P)/FAD-dependent oxidoreductase [Spirochaetota bacterium]
MKKIAVIGGGASGLMAACIAAPHAKVTIFEKQNDVGRKILATGNGRCNISNRNLDASHYFGKKPQFVNNVFGKFGLHQTEEFFRSIGIPFAEGKEGKLFPASFQASAVQKILAFEAKARGAHIYLHRRIDAIEPQKNGFQLITAGKETHHFDAVILATGSCAHPQLGGTESGYALAKMLGHTIEPPIPAIVPLTATPKALHRLQGIKWDCTLCAQCENKTIARATGEVLFTKYGLSGPAALEISTAVNREIVLGKNVVIEVDFFPTIAPHELIPLFISLCATFQKPIALCLAGIVKERIAEVIISMMGNDPWAPAESYSQRAIAQLAEFMKAVRVQPGQPRSFADAMVALGGVSTDEINPATMESKLIPGIFFAGELIDITGTTGGYNLQFAWSSGAIAGMNAAQ